MAYLCRLNAAVTTTRRELTALRMQVPEALYGHRTYTTLWHDPVFQLLSHRTLQILAAHRGSVGTHSTGMNTPLDIREASCRCFLDVERPDQERSHLPSGHRRARTVSQRVGSAAG